MYWLSKRPHTLDPIETEFNAELPKHMSTGRATFWTVIGLVCLVLSAYILVEGTVYIARAFGISDLVIGLTVIAVGTSLPEVAVSIAAALKKEHEIVLGNAIGSNMFNLLAVLGVSSSIRSNVLDPGVLTRDYPVMVGLTILLFITAYGFRGKGRINRIEAGLLIFSYVAYMYWLYQTEVA
jgi:cation:H+ antiporter